MNTAQDSNGNMQDLTLNEVRASIAPFLPENAAFDGWNGKALAAAARQAGVDGDVAALAFNDDAMDLIDAWIQAVDVEMARRLPPEKIDAMKIRDKITSLVDTRLVIARPNKEALRRAMSIMAMPQNLRRSMRINWRTADIMWRMAGDTATDYNHYTKRIILSGVYTSTLLVFVDDGSEDFAETRAFLARRIENVMQFEKAKAKWTGGTGNRFSMSRFLGRLRYPA